MAVPDDSAIARQLETEGYFVRVARGDQRAASLFARLCATRLNPTGVTTSWGWLTKSPGEANVDGFAEDAIVHGADPADLNNVVDTVVGAGAPGASLPARWTAVARRPSNTWARPQPLSAADLAYLRDGVVTGPPPPPPRATKLGVSHFGAVGLRLQDRPRYNEFLAFFRDMLKPDYARIFWWLEGGPWGLVGTGHLSDAVRRDTMRAAIEDLLAINVKPQLTVFGTWVEDAGRRDDLIAQFLETARPYAARLFLVDCYNEPGAIEVPEYGFVRQCGRALANEGYPLLSLASPDSLHIGVQGRRATDAEVATDTSKLYDGMPAGINAITPHWGRNPWEPHRALGPSAAGKRIVNDEPRGYRSSVSWIEDPADFGRDYASSAAAGEDYTLHGEPGIWHGYCDARERPEWDRNNQVKRWQDVPRIGEIVRALRQVRDGGRVEPGQPGPTPPTPQPPPSKPTYESFGGDGTGNDMGAMVFRVYASPTLSEQPNPGMMVHAFRTAYDILIGGMTPADAIAKRERELKP